MTCEVSRCFGIANGKNQQRHPFEQQHRARQHAEASGGCNVIAARVAQNLLRERPGKVRLDLQEPELLEARRRHDKTKDQRCDVEAGGWERAELAQRPASHERSCEKCEDERFGAPHLRVERAAADLAQRRERRKRQQPVLRSEVGEQRGCEDDRLHPRRHAVAPEGRLDQQQNDAGKERKRRADQQARGRL